MELVNVAANKSSRINISQERREISSRWWIVLPVVIVSMTTATVDPIVLNDIMVRYYQIQYGILNASSASSQTGCDAASTQNDSQMVDISVDVQKSVSHLNTIMAGIGAIPAVLVFILLSANSDRIGRKPLLILPCIGRILRFTIVLLFLKLDLNDTWLIIANLVDGLFGSNSLLILAALTYITDCTRDDERSRALILEEAAVALTRIFPLLGVGFWLKQHGYILPVSVNLGINAAALIYVIIFQPETRGQNIRGISSFFKQMKRIRLSPVRNIYQVFLTKRADNNQRSIVLLTWIQVVLFIVLFGFVAINPLYLYGKPLCFDVLDLAILTSAQFSLMILISIIISVRQNRFTTSLYATFIGTLMYCIHLILFGLAQTVWLLYLAVFIGCLFFVVMAILRTHLTKLVTENEYALVFIAAGIVETIGSYAIGIVTNVIYAATINFYPGLIFFVLSVIGFIGLGINGLLIVWPLCQPKTKSVTPNELKSNDSPMPTSL